MTKVAILIDGAYLLKRLPALSSKYRQKNPAAVAEAIKHLTFSHLDHQNRARHLEYQEADKQLKSQRRDKLVPNPMSLLYRVFYYDAEPYQGKEQRPVSGRSVDYKKSDVAKFRSELFNELRSKPNTAVRLGKVHRERGWILNEAPQKKLLNKEITVDDLSDEDFTLALKQKAVDMRIGIDITSIVLKQQADIIVLIAGDADFVPAAKLARREGARIILDPLWRSVSDDLYEHIDGVYSGFSKPKPLQ